MQQNPAYGKNLGYRYPYFQVIRPPVPSNFHPMVYYVPWMMHAFLYEFSVACLNSVKHSYQIQNSYQIGRTWYIDTHTFLKIWVISLPSNSRPMKYWKETRVHFLQDASPSTYNSHGMDLKVLCTSNFQH